MITHRPLSLIASLSAGIYSLFLRMLILTSILESLLNSSFNPNLILMRAASILQPEENNRGQSNMCIMLDVKEFFDGHNSLERYYFRGMLAKSSVYCVVAALTWLAACDRLVMGLLTDAHID